jgi:hypothetical protein
LPSIFIFLITFLSIFDGRSYTALISKQS